jgi:carbon monoxide dehydrogenase subunit G
LNLEQSFEVKAPVDEVWAALIDVQRVAPCLPGAEITEVADDGVYHGTFTVKLGPTTASYRGRLELESLDEEQHVATMKASGSDKRGQGGANATMVSRMTELPGGGTRVDVVTDFTITGRLARFGRGGMIQDISNRLLGDFAACLQSGLGGAGEAEAEADPVPEPAPAPMEPTQAKPVNGLAMFLSVLWKRIGRLFGRS